MPYGQEQLIKKQEDQRIYIAEMTNPWTISSNRVQISQPDQSWELVQPSVKVNEGPAFCSMTAKSLSYIHVTVRGQNTIVWPTLC